MIPLFFRRAVGGERLVGTHLLGHIKAAFDTAYAEAVTKKQTFQRFEKYLDWEGVMKDLLASFRPPARLPKGSPAVDNGAGSAGADVPFGGVPTPDVRFGGVPTADADSESS